MKRLFAAIAVMAVLTTACIRVGGGDAAEISRAKPGKEVALSETLEFRDFPTVVIPYGSEPSLQFSNLRLASDGDLIQGVVDFSRIDQDAFVLVAVLSTQEDMLLGYFDPESGMNLHLPSGTLLFALQGCTISGRERGTVTFSLTGRMFGRYDVTGSNATLYLFSVPGKVNPGKSLPGAQTDVQALHANSNVLAEPYDMGRSN